MNLTYYKLNFFLGAFFLGLLGCHSQVLNVRNGDKEAADSDRDDYSETKENEPVVIAGTNLVSVSNSRVRCNYAEISELEYDLFCNILEIDKSDNERKPLGFEYGVKADWQNLESDGRGKILSSNCEVIEGGLTYQCRVTLDSKNPTEITASATIKSKTEEETKKDSVLLPYSVKTFGLLPFLPRDYQRGGEVLQTAGFQNYEMDPNTLLINSAVLNYPRAEVNGYKNGCSIGNRMFFMVGNFVYEYSNNKIKLFAGSANYLNESLSHRLDYFFKTYSLLACGNEDLFIYEIYDFRIIKISLSGEMTLLKENIEIMPDQGGGSSNPTLSVLDDKNIFLSDPYNGSIKHYSDGKEKIIQVEGEPFSIHAVSDGILYFDYQSRTLKKHLFSGETQTLSTTKLVDSPEKSPLITIVDKKVYYSFQDKIYVLLNDTPALIASSSAITSLFSYKGNLAVTRSSGVSELQNNALVSIIGDSLEIPDQFLSDVWNFQYEGNDTFYYSTTKNIKKDSGNQKSVIVEPKGQTIPYFYIDPEGGVYFQDLNKVYYSAPNSDPKSYSLLFNAGVFDIVGGNQIGTVYLATYNSIKICNIRSSSEEKCHDLIGEGKEINYKFSQSEHRLSYIGGSLYVSDGNKIMRFHANRMEEEIILSKPINDFDVDANGQIYLVDGPSLFSLKLDTEKNDGSYIEDIIFSPEAGNSCGGSLDESSKGTQASVTENLKASLNKICHGDKLKVDVSSKCTNGLNEISVAVLQTFGFDKMFMYGSYNIVVSTKPCTF